MAAGAHRPLRGAEPPPAAFPSLPGFHAAPLSWCEIRVKQVPGSHQLLQWFFFYYLVFSLSVIKLPFASPTVPKTALESVYHMYKFI